MQSLPADSSDFSFEEISDFFFEGVIIQTKGVFSW